MKILFIAMPSVHFIRWVQNIPKGTYEMYWFDILDRGYIEELDSVKQITGWKKRKLPYLKGEYFLAKKKPITYKIIEPFLQVTASEKMGQLIKEIQPDLVHSFEMQSCSYPILRVLNKFSKIKWLYSCWGNDIFYYENLKNHHSLIKKVLKRVNFLHTDCERDVFLATKNGFLGGHFGVIPGGGGYQISEHQKLRKPVIERKVILLKGYEHNFGRALKALKAIELILDQIQQFEIIVFGAHKKVVEYIKSKNLPFTAYSRYELTHKEVLKLMGESKIYIGNNISDGMPNTLLEAIIMGAFPIQSNPGGATSEIIEHGKNGFLIANPEDSIEISKLISKAIHSEHLIDEAFIKNQEIAKELEYFEIQEKILNAYKIALA